MTAAVYCMCDIWSKAHKGIVMKWRFQRNAAKSFSGVFPSSGLERRTVPSCPPRKLLYRWNRASVLRAQPQTSAWTSVSSQCHVSEHRGAEQAAGSRGVLCRRATHRHATGRRAWAPRPPHCALVRRLLLDKARQAQYRRLAVSGQCRGAASCRLGRIISINMCADARAA